jgi:23S rRNA (adenine2030-N6)-methyltransferase
MLSYRHAFHAGNFADVLKHTVLVQILRYLSQKEKAFCYIDTHAGPGHYALNSDYALKNREFDNGIGALWAREDLPPVVEDYVQQVKALNKTPQLLEYPGSPWFAKHLLRPHDKLWLHELHTTEQQLLQTAFKRDKRARIMAEDGLKHAVSLLPPVERRGLVFIDPSYELKTDYDTVVETLIKMHKRFATGTYALWYPVIDRKRNQQLERALQNSGIADILLLELGIKADSNAPGMTSSGLIIINPPWILQADMAASLPWLAETLGEAGEGFYRIQSLSNPPK